MPNKSKKTVKDATPHGTASAPAMEREYAMMRSVLDNANSVIFVKDGDGRFAFVNKRFREIYGFGDSDVSGLTVFDLFPEGSASIMTESDKTLRKTGVHMESEKTVKHIDGTEHVYFNIKFPISGFSGYIGGISTDITERRRIEEELRRNEMLLGDAMRLSGVGVCEWNLISNVYRWANETYGLFGVDRQSFSVTMDKALDLVMPEDADKFKNTLHEAIARKKSNFEATFKLKDKSGRLLHDTAQVSYDENGKAVRVTEMIRDITEKRKSEEELLRAQKLESISELAGGIAHDINNLLQGIIGGISVAKLKSTDAEMMRLFNQIETSALKTRDVTKRLLTFSIGGGPIRDISALEGIIKDSASMVLHGSDVECKITIAPGLHAVNIDEGQIAQAFNNIIMNARHAMNGSGTIEINAVNTVVGSSTNLPLAPGDYALVTIKDNGPGMPDHILPKIFDPFFTTKDRASGLGLAVTFSIIKKHDGHVFAQSPGGGGSCFSIYLPSAGRVDNEEQAALTIPEKTSHSPKEARKPRVLVMDDEDVVRDVSGEMIQMLGYDVEFALNGEEAVELYSKAMRSGDPFTAVIMDLSIPGGMDGKETIRQLLHMDPNVKAIVSSGYSRDPIMEEYGMYGFRSVLSKPYRLADFRRVVKSVVEGQS